MAAKKKTSRSRKKTRRKPKIKYASFKKRFWANAIDILILSGIALVGYKVIFSSGNIATDIRYSISLIDATINNPSLNLLFSIIIAILALTYTSLYYLILWVAGAGQTLGFRIMEIKVIRDDGKKISYPLAYLRFISSVFSVLILMMGFFYILYNKQRKTWHDYICHTSVVEE